MALQHQGPPCILCKLMHNPREMLTVAVSALKQNVTLNEQKGSRSTSYTYRLSHLLFGGGFSMGKTLLRILLWNIKCKSQEVYVRPPFQT